MKAPAQGRKLLAEHRFRPGILKSDCVEHPERCFGDSRKGIALARKERGSLEGETPQNIQIIEFGEFLPIPEGAGSGNDGVIQRYTAERHA